MVRIIIIAIALSGCATTIKTVEVPVPVKCLGQVPERPIQNFGIGKYPGPTVAAKQAISDLFLMRNYAESLEAAIEPCK